MNDDKWDSIWERARSGRHTVIVGMNSIPHPPSDLKVLQVSCAAPRTTGGPLDEARRRLAQLLGEDLSPPAQMQEQPTAGPRHRLLGELPVRPVEAVLVEACNRLADWTDQHAVLVFESIETADEATIETLIQILQRPGWLRLPLILTMHRAPQGPVAKLVNILRTEDGEAVIVTTEEATAGQTAVPFDWSVLPPEVLRVLRAAAVIGTTFEADLIARLLDESPGRVLEGLQRAVDLGAPLADRGEGRFSVPQQAAEALQTRMLPSLLTFWHERLGELLSRDRLAGKEVPRERRDKGIPPGRQEERPAWEQTPSGEIPKLAGAPAERQARRSPLAYAELFEPAPASVDRGALSLGVEPMAEEAAGPAVEPPRPTVGTAPTPDLQADQARAAAHLQAAGRSEAAAEQYLAAVKELNLRGDMRRAYHLAGEALKLLDTLPTSDRRALLRAQLLLEMGRAQWHAAMLGSAFTLQAALSSLKAARSQLPYNTPPDVMGQLAVVTAGVCYDLGDLESLQQALNELTEVSRQLLGSGNPLPAARLLNDQAAIWVRLGDPVRATHLLTKSRELFEGRLRNDPNDRVAIEELGQTDHLLARLPLHAQIRPGREQDAYAIALDHTLAAERSYRLLGQHWELARLWETRGRLELARGRTEAASQHLSAALRLQRELGDIIGLARSTAALADVLAMAGRLEEAAALLADSVALNFEKGSPIGWRLTGAPSKRSPDPLLKFLVHLPRN